MGEVKINFRYQIKDEDDASFKTKSLILYFLRKNKPMNKTIGIILLGIGIIMLIWTGFTYTKKEKVIDAGPIQVSADRQHTVNWPPYAGGILVVGGIILMVSGKRR